MPNHTDFNGDGRDDILWRTDGGGTGPSLGQLNGGFSEPGPGFLLPDDRGVLATGDFNGDGRDDALLRSFTTGNVSEWLGQTDGLLVSNPTVDYPLNLTWDVVGTGDFDGDGRDDVLLRHDNGTVTNWLGQSGGAFFSNHAVASYTLPAGWNVAGTGDFNGDGKDDVLLRHDNGMVTDWLGQQGGTFFSNHSVWTYDFFGWNTLIQPDPYGFSPWDY